jgi:hypothetical protein
VCVCLYIYIYIYIYNAPTLIVFDFCSVATELTLVAIGSRPAAIGWSSYNCSYLVARGWTCCN